jgi:hypothetical protein
MKEPEHIPAQHEVSTNRLETLTDGIFAIAMTLLSSGWERGWPGLPSFRMRLPSVLRLFL